MHRDYHARNLMVLQHQGYTTLGVIDFQDAMMGPFAYDLVSLLKDCYIQWPYEKVLQWLHYFYDALPVQHGWTLPEFVRAFELCGLQRHLRILGTFCRLHFRDQKSAYLNDLPRIFNYVMASLETCEALHALYHFMQERAQTAEGATCILR
jgi:aminoglycoside/choline kinase family phosphotransferase